MLFLPEEMLKSNVCLWADCFWLKIKVQAQVVLCFFTFDLQQTFSINLNENEKGKKVAFIKTLNYKKDCSCIVEPHNPDYHEQSIQNKCGTETAKQLQEMEISNTNYAVVFVTAPENLKSHLQKTRNLHPP